MGQTAGSFQLTKPSSTGFAEIVALARSRNGSAPSSTEGSRIRLGKKERPEADWMAADCLRTSKRQPGSKRTAAHAAGPGAWASANSEAAEGDSQGSSLARSAGAGALTCHPLEKDRWLPKDKVTRRLGDKATE